MPSKKTPTGATYNITADRSNIAAGSENFVQNNVSQAQVSQTERSLESQLIEHGLKTEDVQQLKKAIEDDGASACHDGSFGQNVSGWIGKMIQKAASGEWEAELSEAAQFLQDSLIEFLGKK